MKTLLLQPHSDDLVLFAAYQCLAWKSDVATLFPAADKGEAAVRRREDYDAMAMLGCELLLDWNLGSEGKPNYGQLRQRLTEAARDYEHCVAPMYEEGGHDEHNGVAMLAQEAFGLTRLTRYSTYVRGCGRSRTGSEVGPGQGWAALKFRAMGCYASQIERASTRSWFAADDCLREWIA